MSTWEPFRRFVSAQLGGKWSMNRQVCLRKFSHGVTLDSNKFLKNTKRSLSKKQMWRRRGEGEIRKTSWKINWHERNRFPRRNDSVWSDEKYISSSPQSNTVKSNFVLQAMLHFLSIYSYSDLSENFLVKGSRICDTLNLCNRIHFPQSFRVPVMTSLDVWMKAHQRGLYANLHRGWSW